MKTIIDKSNSRGYFDYGWLQTSQTFSFSEYYNPERMNFGTLRVLNDDYIAPHQGFGRHPHKNMEVVSIPITGEMEHEDSLGNKFNLSSGNIQIMSAGRGIFHSEYNRTNETINFLQIWIMPDLIGIEPSYRNIITHSQSDTAFKKIISQKDSSLPSLNQKAEFYLGDLKSGEVNTIPIINGTEGVYLFVISGKIDANGIQLENRDGAGIYECDAVSIKTLENTTLLAMVVEM